MGVLWGLLGFNEVYGVLMDFLGVSLINGGLNRGFTGVLGGFGGVFEGNKAPGGKCP